ncbi:hypothetical protein LCGC14_0344520 [marine sediment metagenome]|uniref:Uncharacterized protein n=1 Tax=marine sediment metagenome TaxID=412755 RepID=A0A0F9VZY7_9ZZZZ
MTDEFVPSPPEFNLYVGDDEGNIDCKDRTRSGGLWEREKDGKIYWVGKVGGKRVVMFSAKKAEDAKEEW